MRKRSVERDVISKRTKLIFVQIQKVLYKVETSFMLKERYCAAKKLLSIWSKESDLF